jgi:hypothetical protein
LKKVFEAENGLICGFAVSTDSVDQQKLSSLDHKYRDDLFTTDLIMLNLDHQRKIVL